MPKGVLALATEIRAAPPALAVAGVRGLQGRLDFRQVAGSEFSQGDTPPTSLFLRGEMGGAIWDFGWCQVWF